MTVSIVKDWEGDMMRQTPGGKGIWEGVRFVDGNSFWADVVVVLNSTPINLLGCYRKGGKWLMSQEPPHEFYRWQTKAFKSYDKVFTFWNASEFTDATIINTQTSLPWHVKKSYDELTALNLDTMVKNDKVSWITSNLNKRPGHELRLAFLDYLNRENFTFDLFGRGFKPIEDKFNGIAPYKYSIAIENFSCDDYWTEKIADCFLSWTMPIYYGCSNIQKYFPKEAMILIDPKKPEQSLLKIKEAIDSNIWTERLSFIAEARQLVLNKYQFFPSMVEKLKEYGIVGAPRKFSFLRKPKWQ